MNHLVMECHPGYAVVLGDDGRFRKVANLHYEVGQTVTNVIEAELPEVHAAPTANRRWLRTLTAVAACLVLVFTSLFFGIQTPYASVYLTINPEVRIDVSRNDTVLDVQGMNADGTDLLRGYDHRRKDLDTVMDELVDRAIDMGYLSDGGKVTLTLDAEDDQWVVSHSESLNTHLTEHLADSITITVEVEEKQPEPTPTTPPEVVIPVGPDTDYGDSAYGETTAPTANPDANYGDSAYGEAGDSPYEEPVHDDTPYGEPVVDDTPYEGPTEADTPYEEPEPEDSPYEETQSEDTPYEGPTEADTPYEEPGGDDTNYDDSDDPEDDG